MNWSSLFIGVLVGWLVEWIIDLVYWRRRYRAITAKNIELKHNMALLETQNDDLQHQLVQAQAELVACQAAARIKPPLASAPTPRQPDDLRKIEGIGPKIAQILNEHDILTFADLATTQVEQLKAILAQAGPRFALAEPESWPMQAELAAQGDWEEVKRLQDRLIGGRLMEDSI